MPTFSRAPFPTDGLVPEDRQIGRSGEIERLSSILTGAAVHHRVLLDPRRVGKSSTCIAALRHSRRNGAVTIEVDLLADQVSGEGHLCRTIRERAAIAGWEGVLTAFARVMRRAPGELVLLLAGSEESAMNALFGPGKPLAHNALIFDLAQIGHDAWLSALPERFEELGVRLDDPVARITQILAATNRHPLRTNQVCVQVCENARDGEVTSAIVDYAVGVESKRWRDR